LLPLDIDIAFYGTKLKKTKKNWVLNLKFFCLAFNIPGRMTKYPFYFFSPDPKNRSSDNFTILNDCIYFIETKLISSGLCYRYRRKR
jgi:hypothetical protein